MLLTSRHNPLLKTVRLAVASGRPTPDGLVAAEGPHLLEEALRGDWTVEQIFATPGALARFEYLFREFLKTSTDLIEVSDDAFSTISSTEHSQGILTLLRPHPCSLSDLREPADPLLVVLDNVQDPGNAGTVVRSAEAFAATGIFFGRGSVRIANPKFLRATAGSIFRMPYLEQTGPEDLSGLSVYSLCADAERDIHDVDLRSGVVLVTGSEGHGVSPRYRNISTPIRIPAVQVESLNAGVACSIALYEAWQQRYRP